MSEENLKKFQEIAKKRDEYLNTALSNPKIKGKEIKRTLKTFDDQLDSIRDE